MKLLIMYFGGCRSMYVIFVQENENWHDIVPGSPDNIVYAFTWIT